MPQRKKQSAASRPGPMAATARATAAIHTLPVRSLCEHPLLPFAGIAVVLGPGDVAEGAAGLRDALREELSA
ncbi:hypothetical protein [Streptomyces sp. NPDC056190]|uniref:hypothetical protein n=1 Tax=unclassified Streptomyces TaxID=2593676 RepID=UPI0035DD8FB4